MPHEPWIAPDQPDLVWFAGADAVRFLNDLISQEVAAMGVGDVRRSLLLQPQGKLDHILWVIKADDRVGLIAEQGRGEDLATKLARYRIRVDVSIEPETRPTWVVIGSEEFDAGRWRPFNTGLAANVSWAAATRTFVVGNKPTVIEGSDHEYEKLRIESGEPKWGVDVDDKTIPEEAGLVGSGVDFDKGCYLGQELVARIDSRGHVNRHLRILELKSPAPGGTTVVKDGQEVGSMTSAVGTVGLGLVRREVGAGEVVEVGAVTAVIRALPKKPQT